MRVSLLTGLATVGPLPGPAGGTPRSGFNFAEFILLPCPLLPLFVSSPSPPYASPLVAIRSRSQKIFPCRSESHDVTNDARLEGFDESEGLEDRSSDFSTKQSARSTPNAGETHRHVNSIDMINSEAFSSDSKGSPSSIIIASDRRAMSEKPASFKGDAASVSWTATPRN